MRLQHVAFLQSRARFPPHIKKNCVTDVSLETNKCHENVDGCKQGNVPCKIPLLQQKQFLNQLYFIEIIRLSQD